MNRPITTTQAVNESSIIRYAYLGCDRWAFTRWHGAISRIGRAVFVHKPDVLSGHAKHVSNSTLLASISKEIIAQEPNIAESAQNQSISCALIDLPFDDFDSSAFMDLKRIIERLRVSGPDVDVRKDTFDRVVIILSVAEEHLAARNWLTSMGADLVLPRFARIEPVVERLVKSAPRILD